MHFLKYFGQKINFFKKPLISFFRCGIIIDDMGNLIEAKILKGFRDFLPEAETERALLTERLTAIFRKNGFVPIDTPVLEYSEILLRKSGGETEKQVFRFNDNGGRDVSLRFDLTVPLARFLAVHKDEMYFPFKRYHIAKVWRGEKPQVGRYREFVQCDFDCVGADNAACDFEVLQLIKACFDALEVKNFTVKINHRGVFNRFLKKMGVAEFSEDVLRIVDKLAKNGKNDVTHQLSQLCSLHEVASDVPEKILDFITPKATFDETLSHIRDLAGGEDEDTRRLDQIRTLLSAAKIADTFVLDPSVTRGLDYYTGLVFETFLNDLPSIGSVCSGGRYDNLASLYMKEKFSGVGASIGLDRLIAALDELGLGSGDYSFLDAEILCLDEKLLPHYISVATELRKKGVNCEVFLSGKKLVQQYSVAEKKKIPFAVIIDEEAAKNGLATLKNLAHRSEEKNLTVTEIAEKILSQKKCQCQNREDG